MPFTNLFLKGNKKKSYILDYYKNPKQFIFKRELPSIIALSLKMDALKTVLTQLRTNYKSYSKKLVIFIAFLIATFIIHLIHLIYS